MALVRQLEPEVMASDDEAREYDAMDHSAVNRQFVDDLLAAAAIRPELWEGETLDLGTGTACIPIELCRRQEECRVMAVDLSLPMLDLARYNLEAAGVIARVQLDRVDAKQLPYDDGRFSVVMSNSIMHHIPSPQAVIGEAVRVLAPGGLLFFRDLLRPSTLAEVERLVEQHAGGESESARQMFRDSLRAALTLEELQELVAAAGGDATSIKATSDRHWTWVQLGAAR